MTGIRFGRALEKGVSELFYCWVREPTAAGGERFRLEDPAKFWRISWEERAYTEFAEARYARPPGLTTLSLRSREVFQHGVFQLHARLPDWGEQGPMLWFGFEVEDLFGGGVAHFMLQGRTLRAFAGAWPHPTSLRVPGLPSDFSTSRHTYTVRVHENLCLWFIDGRLRAAMALTDSERLLALHEGEPYSLGVTMMRPGSMGVLLDIDGGPVDREWVWSDLHPWQIRVLEGSPRPNLSLKLYRFGSEEPFEGRVEGPLVSHPVPAAGSELAFTITATVDGLLRIEVCTIDGRWIELCQAELSATRPLRWIGTVHEPFARVVLEPKVKGEVTLAEAYVR